MHTPHRTSRRLATLGVALLALGLVVVLLRVTGAGAAPSQPAMHQRALPALTPAAPPTDLAWTCWPDGSPDPCRHRNLNSISAVSPFDVWVVGAEGLITHWNGVTWRLADSPIDVHLEAVEMVSATDGWAVGQTVILHWDGIRWSVVPSPGLYGLRTIDMVSATDGWVTGSSGLAHWDGQTWAWMDTPFGNGVNAVAAISPTDVWVSAIYQPGDLAHWDGQAWAVVTNPAIYQRITAFVMVSATEGWASGEEVLLHWDGSHWTDVSDDVDHGIGAYALAMYSASQGWAATWAGEIYAWDGHTWSFVPAPSFVRLSSLTWVSATEAWAVGLYGRVLHWDGQVWTALSPNTAADIRPVAVSLSSATNGWAVGYGRGLLQWDGQAWTPHPLPGIEYLRAVVTLSSADAWMVGELGRIWHWNGSDWNAVSSPNFANLLDIAMVTPTDGWVVGDSIILHWDGNAWTSVSSPVTGWLQSIAVVATDVVWAVGGQTILHWDGATWSVVENPLKQTSLTAVSMLAADDGWAVGAVGEILHWDGIEWQPVDSPTTDYLTDVDMLSATDGWAVGGVNLTLPGTNTYTGRTQPIILHWDGAAWSAVELPPSTWLWALDMVSPTAGWAIASGAILRLGPSYRYYFTIIGQEAR